MVDVQNLLDAFLDIEEVVKDLHGEQAAQSKNNELRTLRRRFLASACKKAPITTDRKMTEETGKEADECLRNQPIKRLLKLQSDLQSGFDLMNASRASRNTYSARLEWFLNLAKECPWWPNSQTVNIQNQCRPGRHVSGRRHYSDLPLTVRSGQYEQYRLREEETPPHLQPELEDFYCFLVAPVYPKRVCDAVKDSTADTYLKDIRLELGYWHHIRGMPLEELTLDCLVPLVTEEQLEGLSHREQQNLWDEKQLHIEEWTEEYFQEIQRRNNSLSPRTKNGKLLALQRLAHYRYRHQVRRKRDYDTIPVMSVIQEKIGQIVKVIKKWQKTRTYVANQDRKWPDVVEGETALTTLRRTVVEPLRLETRPRRKNAAFREGHAIAKSTQHYLKWAFVSDVPPRRQFDLRTTKVALSCPLKRPDDVPIDGYYFPLPPPAVRDKDHDGTVADNYLYKTYIHKGKLYPEGIWVLELCSFKTDETYGVYSMVIPNRQFGDDTHFYEYLEHYLCGWWMPGKFYKRHRYTWWDAKLKGQVGHWITKGWMEFEPKDLEVVEEPRGPLWRWGYLFPLPETGEQGDGTTFGGSYLRTSYHLIGKRITPHMVRYFWATWAFQVGLTDRQLESLAYAMGHSVKALREMYERCTPEEKLRPIFEVIDRLLFEKLEEPPTDEKVDERIPMRLVAELRKLSPEERQQIMQMVESA
ncbi:MAG: hypothetical protein SFY66_26580 [Oculatellaceae cyanobacterium bins.114]|nr:hypothetical protein [Oculatellaceae cyanobacterium bins.114]